MYKKRKICENLSWFIICLSDMFLILVEALDRLRITSILSYLTIPSEEVKTILMYAFIYILFFILLWMLPYIIELLYNKRDDSKEKITNEVENEKNKIKKFPKNLIDKAKEKLKNFLVNKLQLETKKAEMIIKNLKSIIRIFCLFLIIISSYLGIKIPKIPIIENDGGVGSYLNTKLIYWFIFGLGVALYFFSLFDKKVKLKTKYEKKSYEKQSPDLETLYAVEKVQKLDTLKHLGALSDKQHKSEVEKTIRLV